MTKCLKNCHDLETFWKIWHASYNRYLVRYLYIPLRWRFLNVWIIFTFVAIWHDLEWKLLSWAWVTCILRGPELLVKSITRTPQVCSSISSLISISFLFYFTTWTHSKG